MANETPNLDELERLAKRQANHGEKVCIPAERVLALIVELRGLREKANVAEKRLSTLDRHADGMHDSAACFEYPAGWFPDGRFVYSLADAWISEEHRLNLPPATPDAGEPGAEEVQSDGNQA